MGAVTVSIKQRKPLGGVARMVVADVTWSNSYASGGDTYTDNQFEMTTVHGIYGGAAGGASSVGYLVVPDIPNKKLKLQGGAASGVGLAQATGDQSGTVARVIVIGDHPYV